MFSTHSYKDKEMNRVAKNISKMNKSIAKGMQKNMSVKNESCHARKCFKLYKLTPKSERK